jgi:hypothetical protein
MSRSVTLTAAEQDLTDATRAREQCDLTGRSDTARQINAWVVKRLLINDDTQQWGIVI